MSSIDVTKLAKKANLSHQITVYSLLGSLILFALWFYFIAPPPPKSSSTVVALFHIIPLALFLPGIIKRNPRTYVWLCFFVLLYFCEGVLAAFRLPTAEGWLGLIECLLITVLFIAAMYAARWNNQLQNLQQGS